jgi:hypothetical protein
MSMLQVEATGLEEEKEENGLSKLIYGCMNTFPLFGTVKP